MNTQVMKIQIEINQIYRTAGSWVKPVSQSKGGTAASYVTVEQEPKQTRRSRKTMKT